MLTDRLADIFRGYVVVVAEGLSPERLMNLCNQSNIELRNVRRISYTELRFRISFSGYRRLLKLADSQKYKFYVRKEGGIPIKIISAKKRAVLLPAIAFLITVLLISSTYVWDVRYTGFDTVNQFEVQEMLEAMGLKAGARINDLNRTQAEKAVMENFKALAWVNIYCKGTQLNVQVVEADLPKKMIQNQGVADIIAKKDGYIVDMRVFAGAPAVTEGQTVKKGQVLISGDVFQEGVFVMQVAARGEVYAKTSYTGATAKPLTQMVAQKTGNVYNMKYIRLGDNIYPITQGFPPYSRYEAEVDRVTVVGENMPMSFKIYDVSISETKMAETPVNQAVLFAQLKEEAYNKALSGGVDPKDITNVDIITKKSDTEMQVLVIIEALEEITQVVNR